MRGRLAGWHGGGAGVSLFRIATIQPGRRFSRPQYSVLEESARQVAGGHRGSQHGPWMLVDLMSEVKSMLDCIHGLVHGMLGSRRRPLDGLAVPGHRVISG